MLLLVKVRNTALSLRCKIKQCLYENTGALYERACLLLRQLAIETDDRFMEI